MKTAENVMVKVPVLSLTDHITKARQILRDDVYREVYVQDEKRHLAGYVDITDALRITDTRSNVTVEGFLKDAVSVSPGDTLEKVAVVIRDATTDSAAVVDGQGTILGAVLLSEIFPILITRHETQGNRGGLDEPRRGDRHGPRAHPEGIHPDHGERFHRISRGLEEASSWGSYPAMTSLLPGG